MRVHTISQGARGKDMLRKWYRHHWILVLAVQGAWENGDRKADMLWYLNGTTWHLIM